MAPLVMLVAYATGIILPDFFGPGDVTAQVIVTGFLVMSWVPLRRYRLAWLPFLCLLVLAGCINGSLARNPPLKSNDISHFISPSPLVIEGTLRSSESRLEGGYRLQVETLRVIDRQTAADTTGTVMLYIREGQLQGRPGQVVRWRSALHRPTGYGNPGEFDYPLFLAARGIYVTAFLAHAEDLVILANHPLECQEAIENWRQAFAEHIEQVTPQQVSGLLQSLLLGLRGRISHDLQQNLAASGVAHLFAISGLHFGLLALMLYQAGKWLYTRNVHLVLWCPPQKILPVFLLIPLSGYLFLTGNAWATRRAFLMVAILAVLFARGQRTRPMALLATVAFGLLLFNPLALFQPGFQLSFSGVAGIMIWLPKWQRPLAGQTKLLRWPLILFLTTASAILATAPATLWHFHQFAPAGLLTNLVAIPLIAWCAVPIGLVSLLVLPLSTPIADLGLRAASWFITLALDMVSFICKWPGMAAISFYLTPSSLILVLGALFLIMPIGSRLRHWYVRGSLVLVTLILAWLVHPKAVDFQVVAISVGQGDATLLSLAGDRHFLIDGGGLPGSGIDPGEQMVAPVLGRMGIDKLQGVILTHNHPDHSSGLVYVLRHFQVADFYLAETIGDLTPELQEVLQARPIHVHRLNEGWTQIAVDQQQVLELFAPAQRSRDINERSVVVYARQQDQGVLLTGDLGESGLRQMLAAGIPGRVTLLKLPHHGSRLAHPQLYLDCFKPKLAFVSCGDGNPYGFPHRQTIEECRKRQIPLIRTDRSGMLTMQEDHGRWLVNTGKPLIIDSL